MTTSIFANYIHICKHFHVRVRRDSHLIFICLFMYHGNVLWYLYWRIRTPYMTTIGDLSGYFKPIFSLIVLLFILSAVVGRGFSVFFLQGVLFRLVFFLFAAISFKWKRFDNHTVLRSHFKHTHFTCSCICFLAFFLFLIWYRKQ